MDAMATRGLLGIGAAVALGLLGLWIADRSGAEGSPWTLARAEAAASSEDVEADVSGPGEREDASIQGALGPPSDPPSGPGPDPGPSRDPAPAIAEIVAFGQALGAELDLVKPEPDPAQLERLRELTLSADLSVAELAAAAKLLEAGDAGRVALVLCTTWGAEPGPETDAWLRTLTEPWGRGSNGEEQEALAAVLALDLGGRVEALQATAQRMLDLADGDDDFGSFPGLTSVRAWHALRGIPVLEEGTFESFTDDWAERESDRPRVEEELWSLGVRSSVAVADLAIAEALEGHSAAIVALESLTDEALVGDLRSLAEKKSTTVDEALTAAAALKGLVAGGTPDGIATVQGQLGGGLVPREQALEALRTWRRTPRQASTAGAMARFGATLDADADAQAAVALGLDRCVARVRFRRSDEDRRALRKSLQSALEGAAPEGAWAGKLRDWIAQLP